MSEPKTSRGRVYLVGAGPGDPGLITVRGLEIIRQADVILYDNLATPALLAYARPDAEKLYVGKKRAQHAYCQDEINAMLVSFARQGKTVARLKGGDPFIFGRGGEEASALAAAAVGFEVVPGVSSVVGVAAYAGIPLTHRDHTAAVSFVTGHQVDHVDWSRLGQAETLVVFMGLTTLAQLAPRLIAAGRSPQVPAAAIRWGTRPDQQTVVGTLGNLADKVAEAGLKPPALVIIGEVVSLRDKLNWFERLPLFGRRVVVTRAAEQAGDFSERLRRLGADPLELPTIEIGPPESWEPLDGAIERLDSYDWLVFTSRNGVKSFIERLSLSRRDLRSLPRKICAIGPATAQALRDLQLKVDVTPDEFVAEGLLAALEPYEISASRFLLPRAEAAREILPETLRSRGAAVDVMAAYRTTRPSELAERAGRLFVADKRPDWVTFTSSSTARNLAEVLSGEQLAGVRVASIGPVTSRTIEECGWKVDVEAPEHTTDGLLAAIVAHGS